jgi:hypothetical protein
MAIEYPINPSLGANVNAFPKRQYEKIKEIIDVVNELAPSSGTIEADVISEETAGAGVTVDGVLLKDNKVTATGGISLGTSNAELFTVLTTLTATEIVGTAAGDIGHASGATLVAGATSAYVLEFVSAVAIYDFNTAAYTGGANDLVIAIGSGGAAISGVCSTANLLGAAGDKIVYFVPLATAAVPMSVGTAISLRGTAYTQPGTAAGVLRVYTTYRKILTGL